MRHLKLILGCDQQCCIDFAIAINAQKNSCKIVTKPDCNLRGIRFDAIFILDCFFNNTHAYEFVTELKATSKTRHIYNIKS